MDRARIDVPAGLTRFQIWHGSPGMLWLADVHVEPCAEPQPVRGPLIATEGRKNLVPNSSFECGSAGWGSLTERLGWGNLNGLVGEIDRHEAKDGRASLKIALNEKTTPVFYFDYFNMQRTPAKMPLAGNVGWIPVETGRELTLSAWLKADREGVPAVLAVYFGESPAMKTVTLGREWKRYAFTVKARGAHCFVAIGPDLRKQTPAEATVWIDGVQLERGAAATEYAPADAVEIVVETEDGGRIYKDGTDLKLVATASNAGDRPTTASVTVRFEDFFDRPAGEKKAVLTLAPKGRAEAKIETGLQKKGFYRALIRSEAGGRVRESKLRLAIVAPYTGADSFFGMNHAHPWNSMVELAKLAGITWMRDWSLKWQDVEPEPGKFTFAEADAQIERPRGLGESMDLLLPFPSANWASAAPERVKTEKGYPAIRERMAYMPRNLEDFRKYVAACVAHYHGRANVWEILNEPIYTDYSLPRSLGYAPKDYVSILKVASQAAKKADPKSFVIGGLAGNAGQMVLYEQFIKAGGLDWVDALNIHVYPGLAPPEGAEEWLAKLNGMMRAAGKPRPMWLTEVGYYAEDEPGAAKEFSMPVLESEKLCAAYLVRYCTIMLANGVEKIFFHAGSSSGLNEENLEGIFLEFGNAPRKMYAAQAAMASVMKPPMKFVEKLKTPAGVHGYLFENAAGPLLVAWAEVGVKGRLELGGGRQTGSGKTDRTADRKAVGKEKMDVMDIMGNQVDAKSLEPGLGEYPVYVQGRGMSVDEAKRNWRIR
jgi:hypothetical protein